MSHWHRKNAADCLLQRPEIFAAFIWPSRGVLKGIVCSHLPLVIACSLDILRFQKHPTEAEQTQDWRREAHLPATIWGLFWDFRQGQEENPSQGKHFSALLTGDLVPVTVFWVLYHMFGPTALQALAETSSTSLFLHPSVSIQPHSAGGAFPWSIPGSCSSG